MDDRKKDDMTSYRLVPLEPMVFGDGRPLDRQRGELWPVPATLAAAMNGWLGTAQPDRRDAGQPLGQLLQKSLLIGPLLSKGTELFVPPPADMQVEADADGRLRAISGTLVDAGCTLLPLDLPLIFQLAERDKAGKKRRGPTQPLSLAEARTWAMGQKTRLYPDMEELKRQNALRPRHLGPHLPAEQAPRLHVGIDATSRTAAAGALFQSTGVALSDGWGWAFRWGADADLSPEARERLRPSPGVVSIGGEGRMAALQAVNEDSFSNGALSLHLSDLPDRAYLRLQLLTPGLFNNAEFPYLPAWLGKEGRGQPPGLDTELRLVAMAMDRYRAFSGWKTARDGTQAPRAVRRLVSAGTVYWLGGKDGAPLAKQQLAAAIRAFYLEAIEPEQKNLRLGFGLCLPGYTERT